MCTGDVMGGLSASVAQEQQEEKKRKQEEFESNLQHSSMLALLQFYFSAWRKYPHLSSPEIVLDIVLDIHFDMQAARKEKEEQELAKCTFKPAKRTKCPSYHKKLAAIAVLEKTKAQKPKKTKPEWQ